ncbi:MAG: hypothetical protein ACXW31_06805 [Thermoanaerobaculia bacterium]
MTTLEEIPSVKTAVAREERRRKRVLLTFLALLLIPIAIGVYALMKAPSETELVAKNVTPIVEKNVEENITARVDEKIEPRVAEVIARQATPMLQRTLDRQVNAAITTRVQPLEQQFRVYTNEGNPQQRRLTERIKELEARVAALEERLAALTNTRVAPLQDPRTAVTHVQKRPPG